MLRRVFFCLLMLSLCTPHLLRAGHRRGSVNFDKQLSPLVLETRQLKIPGFRQAHNPSLIPHNQGWLLCFRSPDPAEPQNSHLCIVTLSKSFSPTSKPQILNTGSKTSEDPRLLLCGEEIYLIYGDYATPYINSLSHRRIWIARLIKQEREWVVEEQTELKDFPGMTASRNEKNWVPFCYEQQLLLAYSIMPHRVFLAALGNRTCTSYSESPIQIDWNWGIVRGGTPAILTHGRYLAFFHSSTRLRSVQARGREGIHYFMGAYTFSTQPPFTLTAISSKPIIGPHFYSLFPIVPQNKYMHVVFPSGLVEDGPSLWVIFGKQDCEIWLAKFNTQELLDSLLPISSEDK